MARKSKFEQINSIEEQIKDLEEQRKQKLEKLHMDIGKHVVKSWDCQDDEKLKRLIDHFSDQANALLEEESEVIVENEDVVNNEQRTQEFK
jgi:hypothetical protein